MATSINTITIINIIKSINEGITNHIGTNKVTIIMTIVQNMLDIPKRQSIITIDMTVDTQDHVTR